MSLTYCGSVSIGGAVPGAAEAAIAGQAGITAALPDLQLRIDGLNVALATPPLPINFAQQIELANQIITSVNAAILNGMIPPDATAQLAAFNALLVELNANLGTVNAQATLLAQIQALMLHAGLHVYAYAGPASGMGADLTSELSDGLPGGGGGSDAVNALVLATTSGSTWAAMQVFFKVTP